MLMRAIAAILAHDLDDKAACQATTDRLILVDGIDDIVQAVSAPIAQPPPGRLLLMVAGRQMIGTSKAESSRARATGCSADV